jgi:hypothetical protein
MYGGIRFKQVFKSIVQKMWRYGDKIQADQNFSSIFTPEMQRNLIFGPNLPP